MAKAAAKTKGKATVTNDDVKKVYEVALGIERNLGKAFSAAHSTPAAAQAHAKMIDAADQHLASVGTAYHKGHQPSTQARHVKNWFKLVLPELRKTFSDQTLADSLFDYNRNEDTAIACEKLNLKPLADIVRLAK